MFSLPETTFSFGGDEYIHAEITRDMKIESNFKALAVTKELKRRNIPGIQDVVSSNASYLVRYNPDIISGKDLVEYMREIDFTKSDPAKLDLSVRLIEIPIWYDDPITAEYSARYKDRHPDPTRSNFEFCMKVNGFTDKQAFIEHHSSSPYLVTMIGFLPGTAWHFPLGLQSKEVIQAPKYNSPRMETPERSIGIGGAFNVIYPANGSGSYNLVGMSAVPVFDMSKRLPCLEDSPFLARLGDIWKYRPIEESEYCHIRSKVEDGTYRFNIRNIHLSPLEYVNRGKDYIQELLEDQ
ncbi:5-oxoprolinase subunit B family protein [Bacillus piscicola]|uniref:5-oxoprolinase subunit B family protein n=1 Tax=Bacillus piscicola TaxID=1632684 RepID=UPI001F099BAA|nr:carboxyltransferase domain-containing protein [Bacillus piscicola]